MTGTLLASPDERALRAHLRSARFQSGTDSGRWRLVSFEWPVGVFAVAAAERAGAPSEFALRVDFAGYPQRAPTATPWSLDLGEPLAQGGRPKGERVSQVFRCDWNDGRALYAPWDRAGLEAHADWAEKHKTSAWHPGRDVAFFLGCVHELLNADDYLGV